MSYDLGVLDLKGDEKKKRNTYLYVAIIVVVAVAGLAGWYFFFRG